MLKTALITGASSGIGLGISKAFAQAGYSLALTGLEESGYELARVLSQEHGIKCIFRVVNVKDAQALRDFVHEAESELGGLGVLVNNAGIQHVSPIEDFPVEKWNDILSVNLSAVFHASQAVWPGMKKNGFGRIINIASAHGLRASEHKAAYVTAKHGVVGLTKVMAIEGAPYGISANAVCPGFVRTPLVDKQITDLANTLNQTEEQVVRDRILKKQAVKDFVPVQTLANLCLFLASENSALCTGTAIPVDGGWTVQ